MKFLKDNLPWMVPTLVIIMMATGFFDRDWKSMMPWSSDPVAQTQQATAPVVDVAALAPSAPQPTPLPAAPVVATADIQATTPTRAAEPTEAVSTAAQLNAIVERAASGAIDVAVTRSAPLTADTATNLINDDPAAFFASAQSNLAATNTCGDDLRALASEARIYFPSGGLAGADSGLAQARLIGQVLRACPGFTIQVEGHSDPSGDPQINLRLSQQRAEAVISRLAASGLDTSQFIAKGFGDVQPSGVTGPEPVGFYDRRVEFSVIEQVQQARFTQVTANPWQSSQCAAQLEPLFAQTKVFYGAGSITTPGADLDAVFDLAREAQACPNLRMRLVGHHADQPGTREGPATGRLRALALMNTLVAAGFPADQILIGAPSWSADIPGQPGLPNSRVDFQMVMSDS